MKVKTMKNNKKQSYSLSLSLPSPIFAFISETRQRIKHGTKRWENKWFRRCKIF